MFGMPARGNLTPMTRPTEVQRSDSTPPLPVMLYNTGGSPQQHHDYTVDTKRSGPSTRMTFSFDQHCHFARRAALMLVKRHDVVRIENGPTLCGVLRQQSLHFSKRFPLNRSFAYA